MSKEKLHNFNEGFRSQIAKEYKACRLIDQEGALLVPYNAPKGSVRDKLKEIERRFKNLPDGVYIVQCLYTANRAAAPVSFLIKHGNPTLSEGEIAIPVKVETGPKVSEGRGSAQDITSVKSALDRIEEIATLRAENSRLKSECEALKKQVKELEDELEEEPLDEEEGSGGVMDLFKGENSPLGSLAQLIPSLADQYYAFKNRELDLKERELARKGVNLSKGAQRSRKNGSGLLNLEDPAQVNKYLDILADLPDDKFAEELERVKNIQPDLFEIVVKEFELDKEPEHQEEEQEEEEPKD